jgi:hypothetical protein
MNSRRGDTKDEKPNQAGIESFGAAREFRKQLMWVGYCVSGPQPQGFFHPLKMYGKPPHSRNIGTDSKQLRTAKEDDLINADFDIRRIREHDLLLLSAEKLDLKGSTDIKKQISPDFIRKILTRMCSMLAVVTQKASKGDLMSVDLLVDLSRGLVAKNLEIETSYSKWYIYNIESLATTFREYRTIRMSEFFGMADKIISPGDLQIQLKLDDNEFEKTKRAKMGEFCDAFQGQFNESQIEVLRKVKDMPLDDILLIQGPPGTGKTHTITGIIAMLIGSGVGKVHVCAPSNAAVDEILTRMSRQGLMGCEKEIDMKKMLLRLGAMEYEPSEEVRRHTLDTRLQESLYEAKVYDAKERKQCAEELLDNIKKGIMLDTQNLRQRNLLQKLVG